MQAIKKARKIIEKDYPHFSRMIAIASELNPLQKKRIKLFVKNQDTDFWDRIVLCVS